VLLLVFWKRPTRSRTCSPSFALAILANDTRHQARPDDLRQFASVPQQGGRLAVDKNPQPVRRQQGKQVALEAPIAMPRSERAEKGSSSLPPTSFVLDGAARTGTS
jgi:hypothetical protein